MKLFLAVKSGEMKFHAQHGPPVEAESVEAFLALPEVDRTVQNGKRFGDSVRVMEWEENPTLPNKLVKELF